MKTLIKSFHLIFLLLLSSPAFSQDYEKGALAYEMGDYDRAYVEWWPLANKGDAAAQNRIGYMYWSARGVKEDDAEALHWFRLSANQGNGDSQYTIGLAYSTGSGVVEDAVEAAKWYVLAADRGHATAQYALGNAFIAGTGVPVDDMSAKVMFKAAAVQGHSDAQYSIGFLYMTGWGGLPQDYIKARMWLQIALYSKNQARPGEGRVTLIGSAEKDLTTFVDNFAGGVLANMPKSDIATAQKMALICVHSSYQNCGWW